MQRHQAAPLIGATAILDAIARDPSVDPALRRVLGGVRTTRAPICVIGSDRWNEVRDEELQAQRDDERMEQMERGL